MQQHLIYVPKSEYKGTPELLNKVQEFLTGIASEYDLQPFSPDDEPLQINFYRKDEGIEIEVNYFAFSK